MITATFGVPFALAGELALRELPPEDRDAAPDDRRLDALARPDPLREVDGLAREEPLRLFWLEPFELRDVVFRLLEAGVLASGIAPP